MNGRSVWRISRAAGLALVVALVPSATSAQRTQEERLDRFRLLTNCAPVRLWVGIEGDKVVGLTEESLVRAVRSRLRSARIYDDDSAYGLGVNVHVVGGAFRLSINLWKPMYDYVSEERSTAVTWSVGVTGTHGQDGNYILSGLSGPIDQFLDDYLRVNEATCNPQSPGR